MKYLFKGNLCAYLCEECTEPLLGMEVLLYTPWQKERVAETAVADVKDTFRLVSKEEAASRKDLLIAKAKTDEFGNFEFELDEKYSKTAFDIDFVCGTVPRVPPKPRKEPLQFHLTTIYPQWRNATGSENAFYKWEYCLSAKWWCYIRGHYFDAWVICGHLRNCDTGTPIANASITAWDADFLTDDNLGTALTDANGHFRIDYTSIQFKQTFIPWLHVETDPGPGLTFQSGPDVYFKAVLGSVTLVDEKKADCRKNVGYCLCVNLCSKVHVGNPGDNFPSAWTGIGQAFNITTGVGDEDFDADGYAGGSGKYALYSHIRLTGQAAAKSAAGNPIEYRFLVSDVTTPNGGAAPALANFTKIIGITPGLFVPSKVAKLSRIAFPFSDYSVVSDQADFDVNGWFDINNAVNRKLTALGEPLSNFLFIEEDTLIKMDTRVLTTAADVPSAAASVGNPVPAANKIPIEKFAIRFEIREVVNKPLNQFNVITGSGKTLNSAIMNNNSMFMKLSVTELEATGLCTPINGTVHAKYTVYHPHLASSSLHLNNNSGTVNKDINDAFLTPALKFPGNTNPAIDGGANNSLQLNANPNDLTRCTYALNLYARARLHNGESAIDDSGPIPQLFFYDI
jgi:hypothetical protein